MSKIYLVQGSQNGHQWAVKVFTTKEGAENYAEELDLMIDTVDSKDELEIFNMFYDEQAELSPQKIKYFVEELESE